MDMFFSRSVEGDSDLPFLVRDLNVNDARVRIILHLPTTSVKLHLEISQDAVVHNLEQLLRYDLGQSSCVLR